MRPFVIVTRQRSGSMLLVDILNSHPDLAVLREPFISRRPVNNPLDKTGDLLRYFEFRDKHEIRRPHATLMYLRHLTERLKTTSAGGFKIMYNQIKAHPEILAGFVYRRFRIVHLVRDNPIDILLSEESKRRSNIGHTVKPVKSDPIELNPETVKCQLDWKVRQLNNAKLLIWALPCPTFTVKYEDLVDPSRERIKELSEFLGVDPEGVTFESGYKKLGLGSYRDRIMNYEAIHEVLAGTRYEAVLDGDSTLRR